MLMNKWKWTASDDESEAIQTDYEREIGTISYNETKKETNAIDKMVI